MKTRFEVELWVRVINLIEEKFSDKAYAVLFDELLKKLKSGSDSDIDDCNNFLEFLLDKQLDSNIIVHVLNVLSPIRDKLTNWDLFLKISEDLLTKIKGSKDANDLIKRVIKL